MYIRPESAIAVSELPLKLRVRPRLPERRDRAVDQVRELCLKIVVAKPASRHHPRRFALDKHVRVRQQLAEDDAPALRLEVERDALLARVQVEEETALVVVWHIVRERPQPPGIVALRRLDLNDLSAEVCQELRAIRARNPLREIDDADAFEGGVGQGGALLPFVQAG